MWTHSEQAVMNIFMLQAQVEEIQTSEKRNDVTGGGHLGVVTITITSFLAAFNPVSMGVERCQAASLIWFDFGGQICFEYANFE